MNTIGQAGFGRFLSDEAMTDKHPDVAESIFYSLRGAVHGGQAQYMAQGLLDDERLDPTALWSTLLAYYDTELNRANVVLYDTRRFLNVTLHPDTTASKFVTEVRGILQRLRKNSAKLAEDRDTIRALLLSAIKDDDYDIVQDTIIRTPDIPIETMLSELRNRENSLQMKDDTNNMGGDGTGSTRYSRRTPPTSTSGPYTSNMSGKGSSSP